MAHFGHSKRALAHETDDSPDHHVDEVRGYHPTATYRRRADHHEWDRIASQRRNTWFGTYDESSFKDNSRSQEADISKRVNAMYDKIYGNDYDEADAAIAAAKRRAADARRAAVDKKENIERAERQADEQEEALQAARDAARLRAQAEREDEEANARRLAEEQRQLVLDQELRQEKDTKKADDLWQKSQSRKGKLDDSFFADDGNTVRYVATKWSDRLPMDGGRPRPQDEERVLEAGRNRFAFPNAATFFPSKEWTIVDGVYPGNEFGVVDKENTRISFTMLKNMNLLAIFEPDPEVRTELASIPERLRTCWVEYSRDTDGAQLDPSFFNDWIAQDRGNITGDKIQPQGKHKNVTIDADGLAFKHKEYPSDRWHIHTSSSFSIPVTSSLPYAGPAALLLQAPKRKGRMKLIFGESVTAPWIEYVTTEELIAKEEEERRQDDEDNRRRQREAEEAERRRLAEEAERREAEAERREAERAAGEFSSMPSDNPFRTVKDGGGGGGTDDNDGRQNSGDGRQNSGDGRQNSGDGRQNSGNGGDGRQNSGDGGDGRQNSGNGDNSGQNNNPFRRHYGGDGDGDVGNEEQSSGSGNSDSNAKPSKSKEPAPIDHSQSYFTSVDDSSKGNNATSGGPPRRLTSLGDRMNHSRNVPGAGVIMTPGGTVIHNGEEVEVRGKRGFVAYVGQTSFKPGLWVGVEMHHATDGKHDGTVKGLHYFSTNPGRGLFVRPWNARIVGPHDTHGKNLLTSEWVLFIDPNTGHRYYYNPTFSLTNNVFPPAPPAAPRAKSAPHIVRRASFKAQEGLKALTAEDMLKVFDRADPKGTGMLDEDEFMVACKVINPSITPEEGVALFHFLDVNDDDAINFYEFINFVHHPEDPMHTIQIDTTEGGAKLFKNAMML